MKSKPWILGTAALAAIVALWYLRSTSKIPADGERAASVQPRQYTESPKEEIPEPQVEQTESLPANSKSSSIANEFNGATDYLDFANSLLDRARSGDADAQYFLYAALNYCDESYRAFFKKGKKGVRTLDEALNRVSTRPQESIDEVRTAHERCSRMFDGGSDALGKSADWLKLAADNDQPLALVVTAKEMLLWPAKGPATDSKGRNPVQMLAKALQSKNPEVMWRIGEIQSLLDGDDEEQMLRQWSWMLASCQRGYDCEHSEWMKYSCRFDQLCAQDKNAVDFIRRNTDLNFPEVESRAKEINANIDAGSWDALGLTKTDKPSGG